MEERVQKTMKLSPSEYQVMTVFWKENRVLAKGEIIALSPNRTWKDSYIHLIVRALLKKKAVKPVDKKQWNGRFMEAFVPLITAEEYAAHVGEQAEEALLPGIMAALVQKTTDPAVIRQLEEILKAKRQELEKENPGK